MFYPAALASEWDKAKPIVTDYMKGCKKRENADNDKKLEFAKKKGNSALLSQSNLEDKFMIGLFRLRVEGQMQAQDNNINEQIGIGQEAFRQHERNKKEHCEGGWDWVACNIRNGKKDWDKAKDALGKLKEMVSSFVEFLGDAWNTVSELAQSAWDFATSLIPKCSSVEECTQWAKKKAKTFADAFLEIVKQAANDLMQRAKRGRAFTRARVGRGSIY